MIVTLCKILINITNKGSSISYCKIKKTPPILKDIYEDQKGEKIYFTLGEKVSIF